MNTSYLAKTPNLNGADQTQTIIDGSNNGKVIHIENTPYVHM